MCCDAKSSVCFVELGDLLLQFFWVCFLAYCSFFVRTKEDTEQTKKHPWNWFEVILKQHECLFKYIYWIVFMLYAQVLAKTPTFKIISAVWMCLIKRYLIVARNRLISINFEQKPPLVLCPIWWVDSCNWARSLHLARSSWLFSEKSSDKTASIHNMCGDKIFIQKHTHTHT